MLYTCKTTRETLNDFSEMQNNNNKQPLRNMKKKKHNPKRSKTSTKRYRITSKRHKTATERCNTNTKSQNNHKLTGSSSYVVEVRSLHMSELRDLLPHYDWFKTSLVDFTTFSIEADGVRAANRN